MTHTSHYPSESKDIAAARESMAESLSESQIHKEVINNICNLTDVEISMRCDIMMQSINDLGTIFNTLKQFNELGRLSNSDYAIYLELFLAKFKNKKRLFEFDPRKFSSTSY